MIPAYRIGMAAALVGLVSLAAIGPAGAQTTPGIDAPKSDTTKTDAAESEAAKKPTKAELGEMLKKCSDEADAKGLTVQKGKSEARKAYRRSCMMKNGVAPRKT